MDAFFHKELFVYRDLQVFDDSMLIIIWVSRVQRCHIIISVPILEEVLDLKSHFDSFSLRHVYRERNQLYDHCSMEAMQQEQGRCLLEDHNLNT